MQTLIDKIFTEKRLVMNKKEIRIVYLGTPEISAQILEKLINANYNVVALVSQQDKPTGRKQIITPTPVKKVAIKYGIPVYQPEKIRFDYSFIEELKPDILLTMAYGQLIPHEMLLIPTIKALNLHGSLLPKYRGASPMQAALLNGDNETGITLMEMADKMDVGNMFYKEIISLTDEDNFDTLSERMVDAAFKAFDKGIDPIINDSYQGEVQDDNLATFTKKIKPEDQEITFNESAINIMNKVRAFTSTPGAYFKFNNEKIKILKASVVPSDKELTPGKVVKYDKNSFLIETSKDLLSIEILQKPGKKPTPLRDFFNGNQHYFNVGEVLDV